MKLSVIGCGYLGAVHAASMAELGHEVVGTDVDQARVDSLSESRAPFHEPGFDDLLVTNQAHLSFTTDMSVVKERRVWLVTSKSSKPGSWKGAVDLDNDSTRASSTSTPITS